MNGCASLSNLFPKDVSRVDAEPNRLNNQILVRYFEQEWKRQIRLVLTP